MVIFAQNADRQKKFSVDILELDIVIQLTTDKSKESGLKRQPTKCLLNGAVMCYSKCYLRSIFSFMGQDAASKSHHCANTNVGGHTRQERLYQLTQDI
jgi:hypothetical protein